jgi:uncharacterized protein (TIGR02246 family)
MSATQTIPLQELFDLYGLAWASRDADRIAMFHAEDGVFCLHGADAEDVVGRDAIRDTFAGFLAEWPELGFEPVRVRGGDDFYVVEWKFSAVRGGRRIAWDAVDVIVWDGDVITRKDTYVDALSVIAQVPEMAA